MPNQNLKEYVICPNCKRNIYKYNRHRICRANKNNIADYCIDIWCPYCKIRTGVRVNFTHKLLKYYRSYIGEYKHINPNRWVMIHFKEKRDRRNKK